MVAEKHEALTALKVLIVENNPLDARMLSGMLSKSSYGSFTCQTTDALDRAFQILSKNLFDIILLDLNLKDCTGLETLRKMRKKFPELPIVVNTGAYEEAVGLKAISLGAQDYMIKGKYKAYGLSKALYYAVERKKTELELQKAYDRLKEMQSQLIQVEKMNVVGGLASGVAHEVKNPLATIMYGIEFLNTKLTKRDEQITLTLSSIKEAAKKANNIIKDLLDFANLSRLKKESADLNAVIESALNLVRHQCDKFCVKIVRNYHGRLPKAKIDKNRIEQVIVDIVLNAIFAMKEGGTLTITTYPIKFSAGKDGFWGQSLELIKEGEKTIIVEIDDSGHGVLKENLPKIFDPFFTTRRAAGGVGLGLSIARTIMNNHNGLISVTNREEGGARVRLLFKV